MTEVRQDHPVMIFDADCGFCTRSVEFIRPRLRADVEITGYQFTDLAAYGTDAARASHELLWVEPSGRIRGGAQAVASALIDSGGVRAPLGLLMRVPPVRWIAHGVYRMIANNRQRMPGGTAACAMPPRGATPAAVSAAQP